MRLIFISFILLFVQFSFLTAQESKSAIHVNIGFGGHILDNSTCYHVGINPSYSVTRFLSAEGQLSYVYSDVKGTFLQGYFGNAHTISLLGGGRLYFTNPEKAFRPYVNFMLGGFYLSESLDNGDNEILSLNFSSGVFLEFKKFVGGLCLDPQGNVLLKAGYIL